MSSLADAIGDSIVNPRCDDCGCSLSTPRPDQIGMPRLCRSCEAASFGRFEAGLADWRSQERPRGRTIHVVKLPEAMRGAPAPDPTAPAGRQDGEA